MTKRILLTAVVAAAIFVCCDSLNMIELDSATESASLIEAVRAYYETAIQPNGLNGQFGGKISGDSTRAAVLAEMVLQYPPDWSQAVAWRDGGEYHVATIIGADKPAVSFSHDSIAVVRTLVADLDGNGEVVGGRLVEFVSPDPLDASLFQDYAKQWLTGDFDDTKMLAAEYTTGYAHQQAYLHAPSDSVPVPVNMSLEEVSTPGKGQGIEVVIACWTTDIIEERALRLMAPAAFLARAWITWGESRVPNACCHNRLRGGAGVVGGIGRRRPFGGETAPVRRPETHENGLTAPDRYPDRSHGAASLRL